MRRLTLDSSKMCSIQEAKQRVVRGFLCKESIVFFSSRFDVCFLVESKGLDFFCISNFGGNLVLHVFVRLSILQLFVILCESQLLQ